jgi:hypothetical protein
MTSSPQTVRNFWLQASIDGREGRLEGGPRARDGGLAMTLFQRHGGEVAKALEIACSVTSTGFLQLHLDVYLRSTPFVRSCTITTRR